MEPIERTAAAPALGNRKSAATRSAFKALFDRAFAFARPRRPLQVELIATLNEVAGAVSSAMKVTDVLEVIIDRVKRVTDTDKAVLVLTDEHSEELDLETIVVRGRRTQHPQEWWEGRLLDLADRMFVSGEPLIERHPSHNAVLLCAPVLVKDRLIGLLCAINTDDRPFTEEQADFFAIVSAFAASAIENARLAEQSRYVLLASERDRIAREMHDGVVQSLFSISLGLEVCKKQMGRDPSSVEDRLEELQQHLNTSMTELRRFIYDLRPMKLAELGLVGAMEYWVREVTMGLPVRGKVVVDGDIPRLSPSEEACLYRVTKEAVSNVVRHSGAESFEVHVAFTPGHARLEIRDDGRGFDALEVADGGVEKIGLRSMRHRMAREGGSLTFETQADSGTTVCIDLPLEGGA